MTSKLARTIVPAAVAALVLSGCASASMDDTAQPSDVTSSEMASEMAESDDMASDMASDDMASDMASDDMASDMASDEPTAGAAAEAAQGSYITLAQYEGSKDMYSASDVVLFFAASWCHTCKEATENLEADPAAIPSGLAIVRVDYDDSDELKQKYGVTTQHTFVQVDEDGQELAKWTGSVTADQIAGQTV
jgi:thiol-disulfide isomerase/thioredoxin